MDWSGVDYLCIFVMFLSAVWTLILMAPIHCRGAIGEQVMECKNLFQQTSILYVLRVNTYSANFCFWMNYIKKNCNKIYIRNNS